MVLKRCVHCVLYIMIYVERRINKYILTCSYVHYLGKGEK